MKILTAEQLRAADAYTISHEPVASIDLMERAAGVCVQWIAERFGKETLFKVVCGMGNNGGDGLAIARLLHNLGYKTEIYILGFFTHASGDFKLNLERLNKTGGIPVHDVKDPADIAKYFGKPDINTPFAVVDAILGSGLSKPVEDGIAEAIQAINALKCTVIAIDMPSGMMMTMTEGSAYKNIICATYTLTFETPKLPFFFATNQSYVGEFAILDIGLDKTFIQEQKASDYYITRPDTARIVKPRRKFAHKGDFGHALLVAGSRGKMGAAVLAARACQRAGAGLVTVHTPLCGYAVIQTAVPEAMADCDVHENYFSEIKEIDKYKAIGIGPGIGQSDETARALKLLIQNSRVPMVFDADALNIIAENKTWLSFLPQGSILTPHPGEFARFTGKINDLYEVYLAQKAFAIKHSVFLVLKGAFTSIATPAGEVYFNSTGNPGMATAGSGDTLTGIITGLLAQGYSSVDAAVLGVYLHGLAGDIAAQQVGEHALIAGDITKCLGRAYLQLEKL